MLLQDFRAIALIVYLITALIGVFIFASKLSSKAPAIVVLLSIMNVFLSSYLSVSAYGVVQAATLSDGSIAYNTLNTAAFDPVFWSGLFQILYWFSIITFLIGIAFSLVVILEWKEQKKEPKWRETERRINMSLQD